MPELSFSMEVERTGQEIYVSINPRVSILEVTYSLTVHYAVFDFKIKGLTKRRRGVIWRYAMLSTFVGR